MATDPICGMNVAEDDNAITVEYNGGAVFFCSDRCKEKYLAENNITAPVSKCESCKSMPWYKQKIFTVSALFILVLTASYIIPQLNPLYENLVDYLGLIWWAVGLGLLIGGLIDYYIPREYISKMLAKKEKKTIFHAVILGFLMSACSHGILALSIQLYRKGASIPAVIAFLMAAPWANLTYTILLFSLFGLKALYIIFSAILIALITGIIYQYLDRSQRIEDNPNTLKLGEDFSIRADIRGRIKDASLTLLSIEKTLHGVLDGAWGLATMVLWWILVGVLFASIVGAYVPAHLFIKYLGPTALGLIITLIMASIIEVCSEGSSPIAFEIFRQTGALGNSFVFLMAGVATDYTEIGLLWTNIGKKTALWLPIVAGPQIIVLGYIFNSLL